MERSSAAAAAAAAAAADQEAARTRYESSCAELNSAIGTLESALVAFLGKEEGVKGQVFAQTRARLEAEMQQVGPNSNQ